MIVMHAQAARGISGGSSGPITESKNGIDVLAANRFHNGVGSSLWSFEMHGNGAIAPGILELVASIGNVNKLNAQFVRGFLEAARLVTQSRGEKEQAFW
jgi:hypothetical protein